jgi:hypothetical protein
MLPTLRSRATLSRRAALCTREEVEDEDEDREEEEEEEEFPLPLGVTCGEGSFCFLLPRTVTATGDAWLLLVSLPPPCPPLLLPVRGSREAASENIPAGNACINECINERRNE